MTGFELSLRTLQIANWILVIANLKLKIILKLRSSFYEKWLEKLNPALRIQSARLFVRDELLLVASVALSLFILKFLESGSKTTKLKSS